MSLQHAANLLAKRVHPAVVGVMHPHTLYVYPQTRRHEHELRTTLDETFHGFRVELRYIGRLQIGA